MAPIWIFSSVVLQKSSSLEENGNNVQYKSYYIVFSFELYFAFFPLSFFLLTRSVFMSSKFTCQFCSNCIVGAKRVWPKKKAFTKACQNHFNTQLNRPLGGICDAFKIPTFGKENWGNFLSS